MILRRLEFNYWRHRLNPLTVDFHPGLNVIVGPNEAGKTTLREALDHGLFERPDSGRADLQVIRPKGRDLQPSVKVEFESGGRAYRVDKVFLPGRGHTLLHQWEKGEWRPLAQDRDALARLAELLETDGLAHYRRVIWSSQGGFRQILADALPSELKERLAGVLAGLLLTDADRRVIQTVEREWSERFTPARRQPPVGSLRHQARNELAGATEQAAAAGKDWREYETERRQLEETGQEVKRLEEQSRLLRDELEEARRQKTAWDAYWRAAAEAESARGRAESLRNLRQRWVDTIHQMEELEGRLSRARGDLERARVEAGGAQAVYDRAREAEERREAERQALALRMELLRLLRAREMERRIARLAADDPGAPAPTDMKALQDLKHGMDTDQVRLGAMALRVRLTPERPIGGRVRADEEEEEAFRVEPPGREEWKATRSLRLRLDGIGALEVVTGMEDAARVKESLERALTQLGAELDRWVPAGEDLEARWVALEKRFERTEAARAERAGLEEAYRVAFDSVPGEAEERLGAWEQGHPEEWARAAEEGWVMLAGDRLAELEKDARAGVIDLTARSQADAPALAELHKTLRAKEHVAGAAATVLEGVAGEKRSLLGTLDDVRDQVGRADAALSVYSCRRWTAGEPFDGAAERACERLARLTGLAEDAAKRWDELAPQPGSLKPAGGEVTGAGLRDLEERTGKLAETLAEATRKRDQLTGAVQARADGLGGRRHGAEERLEEAKRQVASQEREATAWDVLRGALEEERRGELAALLDPVRRRVEARLGRVTGGRYRGVELDPEGLRPTALTGAEVSLEVGKELSFGTGEQLALLVRLALAELLAPDGRQVVVLDDPLVNTDPARRAAAWEVLQEAAGGLQLIVLTCHPVPPEVEAGAHVIRLG